MRFNTVIILITTLFTASFIVGCSSDPESKANPYYVSGITARQNNEFSKAAEAFQRCLRINPNHADAHLQLAGLYEEYLDNMNRAMYHYAMYIELNPDGEYMKAAEQGLRRMQGYMIKENLDKFPELVYEADVAMELEKKNENLEFAREKLIAQIKKQSQIIRSLREQETEGEEE